jgi:hypothetical protein
MTVLAFCCHSERSEESPLKSGGVEFEDCY